MKILLLFLITLSLTSCAPFESNYNSFEQSIVQSQKELLVDQEIIEDSFFITNNIRENQAYLMNDLNYLVYFYNEGLTPTEQEFISIIENYREDDDSLPVYVAHTKKDVCIEFITRDEDVYTLQDIWYSAEDLTELPYKKK